MSFRTLTLLLALASLFPHFIGAQNLLTQPVDFECVDCAPADALVQLSRLTGINIVFSDRFFQRCVPVQVSARQQPLSAVLDQISACAPVLYKVLDKQIVFYRKNQKYILSGYVTDVETGERLIGASVRVAVRNRTTITNEFGFFSLTLEEGDYRLSVHYIGYQPAGLELSLVSDRLLNVTLQPGRDLPEVVISAFPTTGGALRNQESRQNLPLNDLSSLPMPAGEADLLRLTGLQGGVQTGVDGLGGLHVRGGNADQNLILLDDVPVYNPSHALGLFSIFNTQTLSSARLWKGDFPARYGGRAASVLDVRTRDGNFNRYEASASIGLLASSATVEGPLGRGGKSSFLASGRGTYFGPWIRFFNRRENLITFNGDAVAYRFFDFNLKLNYIFSERSRLYVSLYRGGDVFRDQFRQTYTYPESILTDRYSLSSDWGNAIAAVRWNHLLRKNLFTNTTLRYSRFYYESNLSFNSTAQFPSGKRTTLQNYGRFYQTLIRDLSFKTDFSWFPADPLTLRWGLSYTFHDFRPGALSVNFLLSGLPASNIDSLAQILRNNERLGADESEAYVDMELRLARRWRLDAGLNASTFQVRNILYPALLPRLRLQYATPRGWSVWAGYHQLSQNLHQIGSFNISLPFELWVPSTAKVEPELVRQLSAGISWQYTGWRWQLEAYDKRLDRVLTFLSSNDALTTGGAEDATGWEDRITAGQGRSRGLEFLLEKNGGLTTGSLTYTLSKSERQFADLNSGRPFPFRFDRRHDVKLALRQRICSWLDGDMLFAFATGNPITLSAVKFQHLSPEGDVSRDVFAYTELNGYRLPHYHRLDLALNAHWAGRRVQHAVQLGVYNVYNRANPFFIYVDAGSGVKGRAIQYTLLPVLPSLRYEIKF